MSTSKVLVEFTNIRKWCFFQMVLRLDRGNPCFDFYSSQLNLFTMHLSFV